MDPAETLKQAEAAIQAKQYQAALDRLVDYAKWRSGGGFQPTLAGDFQASSFFFAILRSQER